MNNADYCFYAMLLNAYQDYVDAEKTWTKFWGSSDDPQKTVDEYCEEKRKGLLDKINRVPVPWEETEHMDRGTAFNEVIDCLIEHRQSDKMQIVSVKENDQIKVNYNDRTFYFPLSFCVNFSKRYEFGLCQYYASSELVTSLGVVKLYGYVDEIIMDKAVDIKVTGKYEAYKFRDTWQHKIYPYCLRDDGFETDSFRYDVVVFGKNDVKIFEEDYVYRHETAVPELIDICEGLITFVNTYRNEITDKKILNQV